MIVLQVKYQVLISFAEMLFSDCNKMAVKTLFIKTCSRLIFPDFEKKFSFPHQTSLMSRIERRYMYRFISTLYLAGLFDIFIFLHIWQNCVHFGDFLLARTLCDANHKEIESH